jgi:hypothetical protein
MGHGPLLIPHCDIGPNTKRTTPYFPIQRDKESSSSNAPQKVKVIVKQPKRIYPLTYHLIADLGAFSDKCLMIKECLICTNNVRALAQNNLVKQKVCLFPFINNH